MLVREIDRDGFDAALQLAWSVFMQFEAPDCSDDGIEEFRRSMHDPAYRKQLRMFGAYEAEALIGVIAVRCPSAARCGAGAV